MALLNYRIDYNRVVDAVECVFDEHYDVECVFDEHYDKMSQFYMKVSLAFGYFGEEILDLLGVSLIDPLEWAEHMGLKVINENGPKIICYKSVHTDRPFGEHMAPVFCSDYEAAQKVTYYVGKKAFPDTFNSSPLITCASGLHASTRNFALNYGLSWRDRAIIELAVDPEKCVVPYNAEFKSSLHAMELTPANKFRFSECFVRKAVIK